MSSIDILLIQDPKDVSISRSSEPVTLGLPLPRGLTHSASEWLVRDGTGNACGVQTRILDRWSDGSLRWVLVDFQATAPGGVAARYQLYLSDQSEDRPMSAHIVTAEKADGLTVNTGSAEFCLRATGAFPFDTVTAGGRRITNAKGSGLYVQDGSGADCQLVVDRVAFEERGRLRTVAVIEGRVCRSTERTTLLEMLARIHFFAGLSTVRLLIRLRNPRAALHGGGFWDLGDPGSIYLKDVSLVVVPASPAHTILCSPETDAQVRHFNSTVKIYQDSSGGENWRSPNHVNRHGRVPNSFRGYRLTTGSEEAIGHRATPVVLLDGQDTNLGVAFPAFWQNFPKAIEAAKDRLIVRLFPGEYDDLHEIQGGEQKTHECFLSFGLDTVTDLPLDWCRRRLLVRAEPAWYAQTGGIQYLTPEESDPHPEYLALVQAAIEGPNTFERKREVIDEHGWRHFGDIYGDHEAIRHAGPTPLVSHYNNQYDPIAGLGVQFLRSGNRRWFAAMMELAAHVIDIDIYHTVKDKSAYNHGLFWHTYHYGDADRATHRSYPRSAAGRIGGGGPSTQHNYTSGLILHYLLTGDEASRETAIDLAKYVIDSDDGSKTVFRWLDRGPTGFASASGSPHYHGPGRGSGNSLNALIDGHRLTGDPSFLGKAEEIIRRCAHPSDDISARDLLDSERKWFYTMFLQALGKYLEHKAELGQLDVMYAYGRASLLHYARWMAEHEYPYLDKPEKLEFPTETWAAQDMRKSEVFKFAALHAEGEERNRFLERSAFFFNYSVRTLSGMTTRTLARPVVLLLSHGFMHAWLALNPDASLPPPSDRIGSFGSPEVFVPQIERVKKRLVLIGTAVALLGLAGIVYWLTF